MANRTETTPEALKSYFDHNLRAQGALRRIEALLDRATEAAKADPKNWGHAGSAGYVAERLAEIESFLRGQE